MDSHSLELLDLPQVRETLAGYCRTEMGRRLAAAMMPRADLEPVQAELDRVDELIDLGEAPSISEAADVSDLLTRAEKGAVLSGPELLRICRSGKAIGGCREFFWRRRSRAPGVWAVVRHLAELSNLVSEMVAALDDYGEVRDAATARLAETRVELRRRRNRLIVRLESMEAEHPEWFADRPTVRRDRFVLPVKVEARDQVPGVVHERSGTGHTLFVEPMATVPDQNELAELRGIEAEEVHRVLRILTSSVARRVEELRLSLDRIGEIDLLLAKVRFAGEFDCCRPQVVKSGRVRLVAARHLLLLRRKVEVAPLDFAFPDDATVVLISGPNAGGKTVAIKTVGVFALMAACGMHVPAGEGTVLPLFTDVFADIGDEQSVDTDLSSFTAHVVRLRQFLSQADEQSLVLLDEIGSSTAPEEGAALATAVLEEFRSRGAQTVATSHFGVLKLFVQNEPGMVNAAMGFREGRPTYRLAVGLPGESSAFEIAASVGLPAGVLGKARGRLGREWLELSARLQELRSELDQAKASRQAAEREREQVARLRSELDAKLKELRAVTGSERDRLLAEREGMLRQARREIENLVREIRETAASRDSVVRAKRFVERELERSEAAAEPKSNPEREHRFAPGERVESRLFRRGGLVTAVEGDKVTVAFGQIRMQLEAADLTPVEDDVAAEPEAVEPEMQYNFDPKLSIRGMTRVEASEAVARFIDEAASFGARQLAILHGKGSGVLQQALWQQLRTDKRVTEMRFAEKYQGGSGVTLLTLEATGD